MRKILVPALFESSPTVSSAAKFWPDSAPPSKPGVFSRMITPQAFHRVKNLLDNTKGTVVIGGDTDEATKFISPTVVKNVTGDDSLMNERVVFICTCAKFFIAMYIIGKYSGPFCLSYL